MNYKIWFIINILLIIAVSGCSELDKIDLSGKIELTRTNKGYHYAQEIYEYSSSILIDYYNEFDLFDLFFNRNYISLSEFFDKLSFTKEFSIGKNNYSVKVMFTKLPPTTSDYLVKIFNVNEEEVIFPRFARHSVKR